MESPEFEMISMADIARLAGQSRATVGNWKARDPEDFPPERGRSQRGPLYDRTEVTKWLTATGRIDTRQAAAVAAWQLADDLRQDMPTVDALQLALLLLAVMSAPGSGWKAIVNASPGELLALLRNEIGKLFPNFGDLLPSDQLQVDSIARAIRTLSSVDHSTVAEMADAFLDEAAKSFGPRGGEYLSPGSLRHLLVELAGPSESVYNPAAGMGQLITDFIAASSHVGQIVGQEVNEQVWKMAQLNLAIHGGHAELAIGDVFTSDAFPNLRADLVVCIPPWNQKVPALERLSDDPRWVFGEPGANDGNAAWIQHCLYHLSEDGRALLVLPDGVLYEGGRAGRMRQRIIKAGLLDAVIALPPGLFSWSGLACNVLLFRKGRSATEGRPASTLMIDGSDVFAGHRVRSLPPDFIGSVTGQYRNWLEGKNPGGDNAAIATFEDLSANDFVIDPGRYLSTPASEVSLEQAVIKRDALSNNLERLLQRTAEADRELTQALRGKL